MSPQGNFQALMQGQKFQKSWWFWWVEKKEISSESLLWLECSEKSARDKGAAQRELQRSAKSDLLISDWVLACMYIG